MQAVELILHLLNKCVCIVIITNVKQSPVDLSHINQKYLSRLLWSTLQVRSLAYRCVAVFSQGRSAPVSPRYSIYDQLNSYVFSTILI